MRIYSFICATVIAATSSVAQADDPNDPAMRTAVARARDREMTRELNLKELARIRQRDARDAKGVRTTQNGNYASEEYLARSREYERSMASYARDRARYDRDMAIWRRDAAACRAGDYAACD